MLVGFVATFACIALVSLLVWDIQRSLGYALLLLPVAWQAGGLEQATERAIARGCFILGFCLIEPFNTVLRYWYHLWGQLLRIEHKADIPSCTAHVRLWGNSGHGARRTSALTRSARQVQFKKLGRLPRKGSRPKSFDAVCEIWRTAP